MNMLANSCLFTHVAAVRLMTLGLVWTICYSCQLETCQKNRSLRMLKRPGTVKSADHCDTQEINNDIFQSASESAGLSVLSPVVLVCLGMGMMVGDLNRMVRDMSPCLSRYKTNQQKLHKFSTYISAKIIFIGFLSICTAIHVQSRKVS